MFYSIIPPEIILNDWDGKELESYQEITFMGRQVLVEPLEDQRIRIVQLISSDPMDFLDVKFVPGSIYEMNPQTTGLKLGIE